MISNVLKGRLSYKTRRVLNTYLVSGNRTRLFILETLIELPLAYFHEFTHYFMGVIFSGEPKLKVDEVLRIRWSTKYKSHVTHAYSMSVEYKNYMDGMLSPIMMIFMAISPTLGIYYLLFILYCMSNVLATVLLVYMLLIRHPWNMSQQDTNSLSIGIMFLKYNARKRINKLYSKRKNKSHVS